MTYHGVAVQFSKYSIRATLMWRVVRCLLNGADAVRAPRPIPGARRSWWLVELFHHYERADGGVRAGPQHGSDCSTKKGSSRKRCTGVFEDEDLIVTQ
jgi:hypothetical protein